MKGFSIAERGKPVAGLAPVDIGGVAKTSDYWSMENYSHVSIIVYCGAITNSSTIILYESDDASGSSKTAIAFDVYQITAGVTGTKSRNAATGLVTGTTNGSMWVIEVDASELSAGYPFMTMVTDTAAANVLTIIPILSGARYAQAAPPTALS